MIIISEVFLPPQRKTIKPIGQRGVAGGEKYIVNSILFKFAVDSFNLYGGDDSSAAKVAGHDLLGLNNYFNCDVEGLCFPLMCLVDYRGFRLIAMSLLPVTEHSIVYGSDNAGIRIHQIDLEAIEKMAECSKKLNLRRTNPPIP